MGEATDVGNQRKRPKIFARLRKDAENPAQPAGWASPGDDFKGTPEAEAIEEQKRRDTEAWEDANDVGGHYPGENPASQVGPYEAAMGPDKGPLTACPECGGSIQATRKQYFNLSSVDLDRGEIRGLEDGPGGEDWSLYCENDHELGDLPDPRIAKIAGQSLIGWGKLSTCPDCRGEGGCSACLPLSDSAKKAAVAAPCAYCGGSKKCPSCGDSGWVRIMAAEAPKAPKPKKASQPSVVARVYAARPIVGARIIVKHAGGVEVGKLAAVRDDRMLVRWRQGAPSWERMNDYTFGE